MDEKTVCKTLRREFSKHGWTLLIYYGIMNAAVLVMAILEILFAAVTRPNFTLESFLEVMTDALLNNGWGYLIACVIGGWILLRRRGKKFCLETIWDGKQPMTLKAFLVILCVFFSGQTVVQVLVTVLEPLLNLLGASLMDSVEQSSAGADSFSMFLYMGLFAPVCEEILFRGVILRALQPYGKKFAILGSAFLFGVFHGNLVQSPYAFAVGLVLGYVTVEYSMGWAMVLHMANNLVLGDMMTRIGEFLPVGVMDMLVACLIWLCTAISLILLIKNRHQVRRYLSVGRIHPWCAKSFFTSPGVLILTAFMLWNALSILTMAFF